jgi:hypothetical protein
MSSDHRFAVLMFTLALISAGFGWAFRRFMAKQDKRWASLDALILSDATATVQRPLRDQRMDRLEAALVNLSETVAQLGVAQSRHEGWHERQEELEIIRVRHGEHDPTAHR